MAVCFKISEADIDYMDSRDLKLTKEVWRKLHHTPELSGQETKTKEILKEYLTNYTTLSVVETPDYLYTCLLYTSDAADE